mmetsp:Transcript_25704/g.65224  ORF Transcript_25704/g.65224 Transcript_25704/m.65224 type:complete len:205 (-) Transcript_25704:328-942(-)
MAATQQVGTHSHRSRRWRALRRGVVCIRSQSLCAAVGSQKAPSTRCSRADALVGIGGVHRFRGFWGVGPVDADGIGPLHRRAALAPPYKRFKTCSGARDGQQQLGVRRDGPCPVEFAVEARLDLAVPQRVVEGLAVACHAHGHLRGSGVDVDERKLRSVQRLRRAHPLGLNGREGAAVLGALHFEIALDPLNKLADALALANDL